VIDQLYKNKSTRNEAKDAVTPEMIEALTVSGDPADCLDKLKRRREFGQDLPILNLPTDAPWEMVEAFIRTMAPNQ